MSKVTIRTINGPQLPQYIEAVAGLRIEVFREFPYLYDGNMAYERSYLQTYVNCEEAVIVLAQDGGRIVGASTAIPLQYEEGSFKAPFLLHGYEPREVFYCAESVLLPQYRGQGLGHRFFSEREAHAESLGGFKIYAFCAVSRNIDHPLRPAKYKPLDSFWHKRGYQQHPQLSAEYHWKDIDQDCETTKQLVFWLKSVQGHNNYK